MRAFTATASVTNAGGTVLTASTEAVILTLPPISTQTETDLVIVDGSMQLKVEAGVSAVTLKIRRGSLTGAVVFSGSSVAATASTNVAFPFNVEDRPGEVAGMTYVVTAFLLGGNGIASFITGNISY